MGRRAVIERIGVDPEEMDEWIADCQAMQIRHIPVSPESFSTEALPCCQECSTILPQQCEASALPIKTNNRRHAQSVAFCVHFKLSGVERVRTVKAELSQRHVAGVAQPTYVTAKPRQLSNSEAAQNRRASPNPINKGAIALIKSFAYRHKGRSHMGPATTRA
jgi:hypothetical protein